MMIKAKQKSIIANLCWQTRTNYEELSRIVNRLFKVDSIIYLNESQANELIKFLVLKKEIKSVKTIKFFNPFTFFKQLLKAI